MPLETTVKGWLRGLFGVHNSSTVDVATDVNRLFRKTVRYTKAAVDGAANTTTAAIHFFRTATNCKVVAAHYVADATLTASNTAYARIQLLSGDGTAVAATVVGEANTTNTTGGTLNIAIGVPEALTLVAAEQELTAGDTLAFAIAKVSTGVAVPAGTMVVEIEEV